ncbi:MAG: site-specific integrase [Acidobacteria bacterium]|nr:site-specific integrase [Acidobacteriota bacterium]
MAKKEAKKIRGIYEKVPGSDVWWVRYADATGRIHREKAGLKEAAKTLYRKRKTEVLQRKKLPEKLRHVHVSFSKMADEALEHCEARKVPEAYRIDCWHMATLKDWFGERAAADILPHDIERKLHALAEDGRKPATLNRYRALLSLVFSLAIRNGKVSSNPVRQVKPLTENNERVRFLDEKEETALREKIKEVCPEREPEFELALHTGMRRGEQYGLRWQDVDLKRGIITIARSKHGEARHVHINSAAKAALLKLRELHGAIGHVCPGSDGAPIHDRQDWFNECLTAAKIANFRWHDLRHTFASRLVMAAVPLRAVQVLMGHKRIETTLRYSHLGEAHLQEAVERLTAGATGTKTDTGEKQVFETVAAVGA